MTATLQINTSGAWRNVLTFELAREAEIVEACRYLAREAPEAKWCIIRHAEGRRYFLFTRKRPCT